MQEPKRYVGIDNDLNGGMTDTGKIIRDAWVFGFIEETETCAGWTLQGIEELWRKTGERWEEYNFLVSDLPDDLKSRFMRIHDAAVARAKAAGWDPEMDLTGD